MLARNALLVDDSKSARFVLGKLLQQHDFNVEMVASAEDALEFLSTHSPDAIFMDHLMKGMDGLVATSVIKKNPATAHIPVVMCTSNDGENYLAEARSHGALGTLVKPPSDDKLEEILVALNKAIENNQPAFEKVQPQAVSQIEAVNSERFNQTPAPGPAVTEAQIEAMIDTLVNSRISLIEESLEAQLKQQRNELSELFRKEIETVSSSTAGKQEIADFLEKRLTKMNEFVAGQLIGLKATIGDEIITTAKLSRHVQEIAAETASSIAEETATLIARKAVQSTPRDTRNPKQDAKIAQQLSEIERSAKSQALTFSILAAIVGAGTAAALFFLVL